MGSTIEGANETEGYSNALYSSVGDSLSNLFAKVSATTNPTKTSQPTYFKEGDFVEYGGKRYVIYRDQVKEGGSIAWQKNNPGNIIRSKEAEDYGAIPTKSGKFAVFPDEATGLEAVKSYIKKRGNKNILQLMKKYAPESDGNDPVAYAKSLAKSLGVPVTTKIADLDDDQIETFAKKIKQIEGWIPGRVLDYSKPEIIPPYLLNRIPPEWLPSSAPAPGISI